MQNSAKFSENFGYNEKFSEEMLINFFPVNLIKQIFIVSTFVLPQICSHNCSLALPSETKVHTVFKISKMSFEFYVTDDYLNIYS